MTSVSIEKGVSVIRGFVDTLGHGPGVYRMINDDGDVLYVGKAKDLKKRVISYTRPKTLANRQLRMVAETRDMQFVNTRTEIEALLLESNMIKEYQPPFNVLLRDDKSYPYIKLSTDHDYPRIAKYRGPRKGQGAYFGPFASAGAVNRTIGAIQRGFMIRNCSDSKFTGRSRPCLQYHIKRCTAPCVDYVTKDEYAEQVDEAIQFLNGESKDIQEKFAQKMEQASKNLDFEAAAQFRDRIRALTNIQSHQDVNVDTITDADIIAGYLAGGKVCIQVFFYRGGRNLGNRAYFPSHDKDMELAQVLREFIPQFYDDKPIPRMIILPIDIPDRDLLAEAMSDRADKTVKIHVPQRGEKKRLVDIATTNAKKAHGRKLAETNSHKRLLEKLADTLELDEIPERIEVYDNSHLGGTNPVGAMIVVDDDGFYKSGYRKFNIRTEGTGKDDYAMMREVIERRFKRAMREDPDRQSGNWPDLLIIDGGKGQLTAVGEVFDELGITDIPYIGVAKGVDRDAGRETIHTPDGGQFKLPPRDPVLYFIQRMRDEAHRFAVGAQRTRRKKSITKSALDDVPGVGPKRKKALLHHFGSAKAVKKAGIQDLMVVEGISENTAQTIYDYFHDHK
jgi:excinuclease ABC subunit C